eukprot:CAMPEP_0174727082 /NCGR_PEP_ID=MMETSP1094-20130205/49036_1 /TAXON_ID=156173 /ORGANISM="Chrysochromulina brevifilum, Strain UTEX LB 985" /LENGTH=50 /DNA_ID=CAMNT_0015928751 /DNA_START=42 /DNA_END=194 /DNA_ORIENTATION=+
MSPGASMPSMYSAVAKAACSVGSGASTLTGEVPKEFVLLARCTVALSFSV